MTTELAYSGRHPIGALPLVPLPANLRDRWLSPEERAAIDTLIATANAWPDMGAE